MNKYFNQKGDPNAGDWQMPNMSEYKKEMLARKTKHFKQKRTDKIVAGLTLLAIIAFVVVLFTVTFPA